MLKMNNSSYSLISKLDRKKVSELKKNRSIENIQIDAREKSEQKI